MEPILSIYNNSTIALGSVQIVPDTRTHSALRPTFPDPLGCRIKILSYPTATTRMRPTTPRSPLIPAASSRSSSTSALRVREPRKSSLRGDDDAEAGLGSDFDSEAEEMGDRRPPFHRPVDGRSETPLLYKSDDERGRSMSDNRGDSDLHPTFSRRSTLRSRSPDTQALLATKKKYTYAAFFLGLSLISFVIQTETAVYIQHTLKWDKAYCML
jgi:hypothetical protein